MYVWVFLSAKLLEKEGFVMNLVGSGIKRPKYDLFKNLKVAPSANAFSNGIACGHRLLRARSKGLMRLRPVDERGVLKLKRSAFFDHVAA